MRNFCLILLPIFLSFSSNAQSLQGAYFGLPSPGQNAVVFAKGIVSRDAIEHSAPAFSPDGNIVLWGSVERGRSAYLLEMRQINGKWTKASPPSFADTLHDDFYPRFSPDGTQLYFSSRRPLPKGFPTSFDMWIWMVEKKENGWSIPVPLDTVVCDGTQYAHSVTKKGSIYFSFRKDGGKIFDIAKADKIGASYKKPQILSGGINSDNTEDGPYVSPDEKILIFESGKPGGYGSNDLYICFKTKKRTWSEPINMGPKINTAASERFAGISPDGKYLFFGSDRNGADVYWIEASIIQGLKPQR